MRAPAPIPAPNNKVDAKVPWLMAVSIVGKCGTSRNARNHGEHRYATVEKQAQMFSHCHRWVNFIGRNTLPWRIPPRRTAQSPKRTCHSTTFRLPAALWRERFFRRKALGAEHVRHCCACVGMSRVIVAPARSNIVTPRLKLHAVTI